MSTFSAFAPAALAVPFTRHEPLAQSPSCDTAELLREASFTLKSMLAQQSPRLHPSSLGGRSLKNSYSLTSEWRPGHSLSSRVSASGTRPTTLTLGSSASVPTTQIFGFDLKSPTAPPQEPALPVQLEVPEEEALDTSQCLFTQPSFAFAQQQTQLHDSCAFCCSPEPEPALSLEQAALPQPCTPAPCTHPTVPYGRFQLHAEDAAFLSDLVSRHHPEDPNAVPPPREPSPPLPERGPRYSHAYLHWQAIPEDASMGSSAAHSLVSTACCTPALSRVTTYSDFSTLAGMSRVTTHGDLSALAGHSACHTPSILTRSATASDLQCLSGGSCAEASPQASAAATPSGAGCETPTVHAKTCTAPASVASDCCVGGAASISDDSSDDPCDAAEAPISSETTTSLYEAKLLGEGTFAVVYLWVISLPSACGSVTLACKRVRGDCYGQRRFTREVEGLIACRGSPFVLHLYGASPADAAPYTMFLEFAEKGSVQDLINWRLEEVKAAAEATSQPPPAPNTAMLMPEEHLKWYAVRMVAGVAHVHKCGYAHRDIKPGNIFLDGRTGAPLLADFDYSEQLPGADSANGAGRMTGFAGTISYAAPEVMRSKGKRSPVTYGVKADLWSLGVVLLQMAGGALPQEGAAGRRPAGPWEGMSQELFDFLWNGLLVEEEAQRLDAPGACKHAWFKGVDWANINPNEMAPYF